MSSSNLTRSTSLAASEFVRVNLPSTLLLFRRALCIKEDTDTSAWVHSGARTLADSIARGSIADVFLQCQGVPLDAARPGGLDALITGFAVPTVIQGALRARDECLPERVPLHKLELVLSESLGKVSALVADTMPRLSSSGTQEWKDIEPFFEGWHEDERSIPSPIQDMLKAWESLRSEIATEREAGEEGDVTRCGSARTNFSNFYQPLNIKGRLAQRIADFQEVFDRASSQGETATEVAHAASAVAAEVQGFRQAYERRLRSLVASNRFLTLARAVRDDLLEYNTAA